MIKIIPILDKGKSNILKKLFLPLTRPLGEESFSLSKFQILLWPIYFSLLFPAMATQIRFSCPHGQIPFKVELAQTPQKRAKGLMHREALADDEGMLFLFPQPHPVTMWMKDTPLSLDMIFMDNEGKILAIEETTIPHSLKMIGPIESTSQVLELKGGTVKKQEISKQCILMAR